MCRNAYCLNKYQNHSQTSLFVSIINHLGESPTFLLFAPFFHYLFRIHILSNIFANYMNLRISFGFLNLNPEYPPLINFDSNFVIQQLAFSSRKQFSQLQSSLFIYLFIIILLRDEMTNLWWGVNWLDLRVIVRFMQYIITFVL